MGGFHWAASAVAAAATLVATAALALADEPPATSEYLAASGSAYTGPRPTAVGLPQIGATDPIGANEMATFLRRYHDTGAYDGDLSAVAAQVDEHLAQRLARNEQPAKRRRRCTVRYRRVRVQGARGRLYRRVRRCRTIKVTPPRLKAKPAIVFDLDETTLSNYETLSASNFSLLGIVPAAAGSALPLRPILDLYRRARERGVAAFFVSSRSPSLRPGTEGNLRSAGYEGWEDILLNGSGAHTAEFKAAARTEIEGRGFEILANVGDQESDLTGGHADRGFKLPNPFYFLPD